MRVAISFDYDSPAGYRQSFNNPLRNPWLDFDGTEALLSVLAAHDVKATFAVVGHAALEGTPPEQCRDQIRKIYAAGHEIASHSMFHRFIPPMTSEELFEDLHASKRALESCIRGQVRGFIPPFNRPCHFPEKRAYSVSDVLGLKGRGRGRQSVVSMLRTLRTLEFGWCRVSYRPSLDTLKEKLRIQTRFAPIQPFIFEGVVVVPLHATGFSERSLRLIREYLDTDWVLSIFAHPNKAIGELDERGENDERAELLDSFLSALCKERSLGKLQFCTMAEIETAIRQGSAAQCVDVLQ